MARLRMIMKSWFTPNYSSLAWNTKKVEKPCPMCTVQWQCALWIPLLSKRVYKNVYQIQIHPFVMIKVAWFASGRLRPHVFANQNNFCTLSPLSQIQNILKLLLRLNRHGFNSLDLFIFGKIWISNSSESWRLIEGAETTEENSFNYLSNSHSSMSSK